VPAAARYAVHGYPTLIVLDAEGTELLREQGMSNDHLPGWLKSSARARASDAELSAQIKAHPDDVGVLWLLAQRAHARKDAAAERSWLVRIEAADKSKDKKDAARAAWQRFEADMTDKVQRDVRAQALDYVHKYPGQGGHALGLLAAAGADKKTLDAELARVVAATTDPDALNNLVYESLGMGAHEAALRAAEKQAQLKPEDPNVYDSLAEVYNYRHEKQKAIETEQKGLAMKDVPPDLQAAMRDNIKRFETGGPSHDVRPPSKLQSPLTLGFDFGPPFRMDGPKAVAQRLFSHETAAIAQKCADKGRGLEEAYVRIQVGKSAVEKVEVLEPGASAAFRKCVDKAIRAVAIPADSQPVKLTVGLPLKSADGAPAGAMP